MKIDVVGCGSAYSTEHNTSSIRVMDNTGLQWLIDCGATVPRALWQRDLGIDEIDAIYFTHIHPDHCLGLTTLLNRWHSRGRQKPLEIWCQGEHKPWLETLTQLAYWPEQQLNFQLSWHEAESEFSWRHWHIKTAFSQHEISNRSIRIEIEEHSLFFSGDGRPITGNIKLMENADIVFQECGSLKALPNTSSHGDLPDCLALRDKVSFGQLCLYHCADHERAEIEQEITSITDTMLVEERFLLDIEQIKQDIDQAEITI